MVPTRMKTTVFVGPGAVEVREVPLPPLAERQVLVQVKACAICTWEQRFYRGSKPEDYPFRGGHEVSGVVIARGADAQCDAQVGDVVCLELMAHCGQCYYCRRGMDNQCQRAGEWALPGQPWGPGGMSDYVIAEDYMVFRIGATADQVDFPSLALAEPVACVARGIRRTPLAFGDTAVVQGAGVMGLLHLLLLQRRGVRVIVSEPDPDRRAKALALGATAAFDPLREDLASLVRAATDDIGAEAIFFTAGGVPALRSALPGLARGGWLMLYGSVHPKGELPIDPNDLHYRELVVAGTFSHDKESFREAVALLDPARHRTPAGVPGRLDVTPFVSETMPFPDVERAMQRALASDTYRVVLTF